MPLTLEIVTPEARVYSDTIDSVVIPTTSGEIGVLPGHIPLLTQVSAGALHVTKGGVTQLLAVSGGFAQISDDKVSVLAQSAIEAEKIDEQAAENAMKRAQEELAKGVSSLPPAELERLEGIVRFSVAQLGVRKRR
jgi:F-type H+-transporting ATPase subunit epsilon